MYWLIGFLVWLALVILILVFFAGGREERSNLEMNVKCLESAEGNVWKYIFDFGDAIAEAVLYRYGTFQERTVICCSVQSGCPVGCGFCGTGKHFVRNLSVDEIVAQVDYILANKVVPVPDGPAPIKFQIMFMSMGEPMLNWEEVEHAIRRMYYTPGWKRSAQYLISTVGINDHEVFRRLVHLSTEIPTLGLQFSIHRGSENSRNILIPFKNKMSLRELRDAGMAWNLVTGRKVYLNYCVGEDNSGLKELNRLQDLFSPSVFNFTFSVICDADEAAVKEPEDLSLINVVADFFSAGGYNTRVFNPAGKEDIGGGCGQLWYVQGWLKKYKEAK